MGSQVRKKITEGHDEDANHPPPPLLGTEGEMKEKLTKSRGKEKLGASRSGDKLRRSDLKRSWAEDELEEIIVAESASHSDDSDPPEIEGDGTGEDHFGAVPDEVILNVYRYALFLWFADQNFASLTQFALVI